MPAFLTRKGTHVGLRAAVERGPSHGACSRNTGTTWVFCCSASFLCSLIWETRPGGFLTYAELSHPPTHWEIFVTRPTLRLFHNRFPETCQWSVRGASDSPTSPEGVGRLFFTARVERPPIYRRGSAPRRTVWLLPRILLRPRVARAQKIIRLHPVLCSGSIGPTGVSFDTFFMEQRFPRRG